MPVRQAEPGGRAAPFGAEQDTGTVTPNSNRTPTAPWTKAAASLPVHPVMNLSATTTRIAIGSVSLSSVVVSAVIGLPRGF